MAPSAAAQKREFPILSTVGLVFVLFLVAVVYWVIKLREANDNVRYDSLSIDDVKNDYREHKDKQKQCYQGGVLALLLIIALILARGHIFRPMHLKLF